MMNEFSDLVWMTFLLGTTSYLTLSFTAFPERPGALRKFLLGLHQGWNISLFHYRNHGGGECLYEILDLYSGNSVDLAKVLAGIQVPNNDQAAFDQFLKKLDYPYVEETDNSVYHRFLRG
jgi:threonine dehydratase